jgi:WD40 repeat protein
MGQTCPARTPAWSASPAPRLLVNSAAISADGGRVVAGTFYHSYKGGASDAGVQKFGTYCYDRTGRTLWSQVVDTTSEGVYWVTISADGRYAAAGGLRVPSSGSSSGFIQAFDAATGTVLLDDRSPASRVNRVALSRDGGVLAAGAGSAVYVSRRDVSGFRTPVSVTVDSEAVSVDVSGDGAWIVAGTFQGVVYLCRQEDGRTRVERTYQLPQGATCHSVQVSDSGDWIAAGGGGRDELGVFTLFARDDFAAHAQPLWIESVKGSVFSVALSEGDTKRPALVGATSNEAPAGRVLIVETSGGRPGVKTSFETLRAPNCVSLDASGRYAAIADGYPENTAGHFYLVDTASGVCRWMAETGNMNWPIALAADGSGIVGGSDDSHLSYFTP